MNEKLAIVSSYILVGSTLAGGSPVDGQISKRVAVAVMRLFAIIVYPSYAGVIISTLTIQYPMYPFTDLTSFADAGSYKLGSPSNTFGVGYFEVRM